MPLQGENYDPSESLLQGYHKEREPVYNSVYGHEAPPPEWPHVTDLDVFFASFYGYYRDKGLPAIILTQVIFFVMSTENESKTYVASYNRSVRHSRCYSPSYFPSFCSRAWIGTKFGNVTTKALAR